MLLWQAVGARADPLEDCEQARDVDRRIHGCTHRIHQFPRDATAFFNRGSAHLSKGEIDRAIADYTGVIQIDPAYSPAYYRRGIAYESRKQFDQDLADFSKAVEIHPRHGDAFDVRARTYLKVNQHKLALRDAERAVSIDPFDAGFLDTRAHVYEVLGRTQEAITDYRRVLSSNPSLKSAIDGLGRLGFSVVAAECARRGCREGQAKCQAASLCSAAAVLAGGSRVRARARRGPRGALCALSVLGARSARPRQSQGTLRQEAWGRGDRRRPGRIAGQDRAAQRG